MPDLLVNLYDLDFAAFESRKLPEGVRVKRAFAGDKAIVLDFVRANFSEGWVYECEYAMFNSPASCYVAVKDKEVIGFACYDTTTKGFFGPIGVRESARKGGIGTALLISCLRSMKESGYAYAIIGWANSELPLYTQVKAVEIAGWSLEKSVYSNMVKIE